MKAICTDPFFDIFIIICILLNTGFLAAEYEPMDNEIREIFDGANYVSKSIFLCSVFFFEWARSFIFEKAVQVCFSSAIFASLQLDWATATGKLLGPPPVCHIEIEASG